jgi:prepilin-type processing-associated H-X9-DG protein
MDGREARHGGLKPRYDQTHQGKRGCHEMSVNEPQPAAPKPERSGFQFSLQTLLLLFVVLGSSLAVFGVGGIVVFAITVGLAIYLHRVESLWSLTNLALIVLCLTCLAGLLMPAVQSAHEVARRVQCNGYLKQIAMALHNYHDANGCFPPAYIADKNGKRMHSWRVLILPGLEWRDLYKAYDFTEPWNGPNNKKLLATPLPAYVCPSDPNAYDAAQTSYLAVVGPNAAWPGEKSRKLGPVDFPGGASNTIMVVEVANSGIPWMEPRDLSLDTLGTAGAKSPALTVSSNHGPHDEFFFIYDQRFGANVAMADGSVYYLPPGNLSTERLRKILQVGGYKEKETGWGDDSYDGARRLNWPNIAALAVWLLSVGTLLVRAVRSRKARQTSAATSNIPLEMRGSVEAKP